MASPVEYIVSLVVKARDEATSILGGITGKVAALGAGLAAFAGVKLFSAAVGDAAEFERAMDRVAAKTDDLSDENFAKLKTAAEEATKATGIGATEAAAGLEILAGAGYKTEEAIATLPTVLKIATLEGISLEQAALAVSDAMTVMGLSKTQAAQAGDVLAKAANLEATTVTDLAEAVREGGSAAKAFGLDLNQTAAILDIFAKNGLRSSEAGTALNALLRELSNPASKARQELAALGDTSGTLTGAIDTLAAAGDRGKLAVLAFGDEAGPVLRALIKEGIDGLADYETQLRNSTGTMDAAANQLSGNLTTAWNKFVAVLDSVRRFFVTPLLEPLSKELDTLTQDLDGASKNPAFAQLQTTITQVFTAGLASVREFITGFNFTDALQSIKDFAQSVSDNLSGVKTAFGVIKDVADTTIQGLGSAVDVTRLAFNKLTGDSAGVDAALASLSARGERITGNFTDLTTALGPAQAGLKAQGDAADVTAGQTQKLADAVQTTVVKVQEATVALDTLGQTSGDAAAELEDASARIVAAQDRQNVAVQETKDRVAQLRLEYEGFLAAGDTQGAAEALVEINRLLEQTSKSANDSGQAITTAFATLGVKSQEELNNLTRAAQQAFDTIRNSGTVSTADIRAAWIAYAETAVQGAQNLSEQEQRSLSVRLEMQAAIYGARDAYNAMAASLGQATQQVESLATAEKNAVDQADQLAESTQQAGAAIQEWTGDLADVQVSFARIGNLSGAAFDVGGIREYQAAVDAVDGALGRVDPLLTSLSDAVQSAGQDAASLGGAFEAGVTSVQSLLREAGGLASTLENVRGYMEDTAKTAAQDLRDGIADAKREMQAFADAQRSALADRLEELEDYRAEGNELRQEELRHERELNQLLADQAKARKGLTGDARAEALASIAAQVVAENNLHALKLKNIQAEQQAQQTAAKEETQASTATRLKSELVSIASLNFDTANAGLKAMLQALKDIETQAAKTAGQLREVED